MTADLNISDDATYLTVKENGSISRFHAIWLRDNATDKSTRAESNGQKLITLQTIPENTTISAAKLCADQIEITFSPENLTSKFDIHWLREHTYDKPVAHQAGWIPASIKTWDSTSKPPVASFEHQLVINDDQALHDWLAQIAAFGFGRLTGGPTRELALFDIIDRFGFIRETNYGKHFDVRTEVNPTNLAYTGLGLQAHTDNPYRDPVPTLQCLYCLESSAAGGDNTIVDGFRVADRLRQEFPDCFKLLTSYCVRFEYGGDDSTDLQAKRPMIELGPDGELLSIRFNNRSAAAITDVPFEKMMEFYQALRCMAKIIDDPSMELQFRLEPGDSFIVDNTRILHARKPYSGNGTRWLQGCYADKDGLLSTLAVLKTQQRDNTT